MSYNEHTKQKQQTKVPTDDYRKNWDNIFKKEEKKNASKASGPHVKPRG
jgi:hypothetical protein